MLKQKLVLKKHSNKVKQRARVSFTNTNKYRVIVLAGNPKKNRPAVQRVLYPEPLLHLRHQAQAPRLPRHPGAEVR